MSAKARFRQMVVKRANLARLQGALSSGLSPGQAMAAAYPSGPKPSMSTGASMGPASTSGMASPSKFAYQQVVIELEWEKTAGILFEGERAAAEILRGLGC